MLKSNLERSFLGSYKVSRYNIVSRAEDGAFILYNSLTGARVLMEAALLEDAQIRAFESDAWSDGVPLPDKELLATFVDLGFFVPSEIDELQVQLTRHHNLASNPAIRRVTVVLTRKCNLGCNYCYQDKDLADPRLNIEQIIAHLKGQVVPGGRLQVTWFGGEPLLRLSLIEELTHAVRDHCRAMGTHYQASTSTNGVLLNRERVEKLLALDVGRYQISLDGPPEIQEHRRPSLNRAPTYDTILDNIGLLLDAGAQVDIKVIIDRENWQRVPELFNDLARRDLLTRLRFGIQETEGKFAALTYDPCFGSFAEYTEAKMTLKRVLCDLGYALTDPAQKGEFCSATSEYSTIIDMSGVAYRCATEPENTVGAIAEDGTISLQRPE